MNAIETILDKPIFQALGWTLIHFIWQGALIAVIYASVSVLLRRFTASVRYAAACSAMLLMLLAPVATMLAISSSTDKLPATTARTTPDLQTAEAFASPASSPQLMAAIKPEIEPTPLQRPNSMEQWAQERLPRLMPWLLAIWFAGVLFLSLRFAGGLITVQRLKRIETNASSSVRRCQETLVALSGRLRVSRPVRLCESALVEVPTVIGWLRPVILLPASALTGLSPEQLEALLAHELAHIRRYDYLVNLLQTTIETLFFYHPAVWWVSAQVRQEREHCCDDLAVAACGDVLTYARALTALEHLRGAEPQLAVAASGGSLLVRIQRLVRGRAPAFYAFESGFAGFIALATIFLLLAGAQTALLSRNAKAAAVKDPSLSTLSEKASLAREQTPGEVPAAGIERRATDRVATQPDAAPLTEEGAPFQESTPPAGEPPAQDISASDSQDFKSEMTAAGLINLNSNQLNAFRVHGVTPQFVREMAAIVTQMPAPDQVVAMRIHGVSPENANEFKAMGITGLNADRLIAFAIHGVTPRFVSDLKAAGYARTDPDSLIAFRIHGVTPAFIQQMKDIGFANLTADELMAFAIHGVTPLFVQTIKSLVRGKLSKDDLLALRIHGVTPEMIKELEILGFANLKAEQLTAFRIHGVTPGFIKSIQEAGYDRVTSDELIELRIFGVTPEFIRLVKDRGFTDVTLHQLAELRRMNILPSAKKN